MDKSRFRRLDLDSDDEINHEDEPVEGTAHLYSQSQFSEVSEKMDCEELAVWLQRKGIPEHFAPF